jgi:hypothetical protein
MKEEVLVKGYFTMQVSCVLKEQNPGPWYGGELDLRKEFKRCKTGNLSFCYFGTGVNETLCTCLVIRSD